MSISSIFPSPLHFLQYPLGELNENEFGSGFSYEIPVVGHVKFRLKYLNLLVFISLIIKEPFDSYKAIVIEFLSRFSVFC